MSFYEKKKNSWPNQVIYILELITQAAHAGYFHISSLSVSLKIYYEDWAFVCFKQLLGR